MNSATWYLGNDQNRFEGRIAQTDRLNEWLVGGAGATLRTAAIRFTLPSINRGIVAAIARDRARQRGLPNNRWQPPKAIIVAPWPTGIDSWRDKKIKTILESRFQSIQAIARS